MFSDPRIDGEFSFAPMSREHLSRVLAIEHDSFPSPWSEENFLSALGRSSATGIVAEFTWSRWSKAPHVVGFVVCEMHNDCLHLTNLAVDADWRRCGVGRRLLQTLADAFGGRRTQLVLTVREGNTPAQLFFRALGFRAVSTLPHYFTNSDEAAYRMARRLPAPATSDCQGATP